LFFVVVVLIVVVVVVVIHDIAVVVVLQKLELPLADEAVVLVVGVVLCVPLELCIEVHVQIRAASRLVLLEVGEHHLSSRNPLEALVPICVQPSQPVVSSILGVDHVEDGLDKVTLSLV